MSSKFLILSLIRSSAWLAILVVIFVPLERFFAVQPHKTLRKGLGVDICYYFLNGLAPALILAFPAAILVRVVRHIEPPSIYAYAASLPFWAHAAAAMVVGEIGYYWGHRWSHELPFLWRFHSVHHSAEEIDFLVSTRAHPVDMVFTRFCGIVPMCALGLAGPTTGGSGVPVFVLLIGTMWGFFVHGNVRWRFGPIEWLISTPMFHHWHHTKTGPIDHNYASMLPWLDRLFGTHILPKEWPKSYGISTPMPTSLLGELAYPFIPENNIPVELNSEDTQAESPS